MRQNDKWLKFQTFCDKLKMHSEGLADNLNGLNILPPIVRGAPTIRSIKITNFTKMLNTG